MAQTHHYLFDTATGFNDSTGSNNLTAGSGYIETIGAKINQCVAWFGDGSSNCATGGTGVNASFSIAFWIKAPYETSSNYIEAIDLVLNPFGPYVKIKFLTSPSGQSTTTSVDFLGSTIFYFTDNGANQALDNWRHFAFSYDDNSGKWEAWADGNYYGQVTNFILVNGFSISKGFNSEYTYIDDLRIYDSVIDAAEVAFIYNSGTGTQANSSGSGNGLSSGSFPTIYVNPIAGTASGSAGPGAALGSFPSVLMSAPSGNANINGIAFGLLSTVNVISFQGIAYPEFIAYGSLATISVSAIQAVPVIGTTIQLDYVACDGEVTWTQNLPITGFSSAIQGQDAISSRITPTIGASGANIVFFEQRTLAASGNQTYDLKSLTDFLGGALSLDRAYAIILLPSSGSVSLSPGASNPFQWFFASSTANISLSSQNVFMFAQRESATITSGSKTLKVTNTSGAASATYKIAILGGR